MGLNKAIRMYMRRCILSCSSVRDLKCAVTANTAAGNTKFVKTRVASITTTEKNRGIRIKLVVK